MANIWESEKELRREAVKQACDQVGCCRVDSVPDFSKVGRAGGDQRSIEAFFNFNYC